MTLKRRLQIIKALSMAIAHLSDRNFSRVDLSHVIGEIQGALEELGIEELHIEDNGYSLAKQIFKS